MTDVQVPKAAFDLDAKYREEEGSFYYTGIHALVRVPLDQMRIDRRNGLKTASFISGYQGSPLGGFDREIIAHKALMDQHHIVHTPGLNEELGATAVMGSQVSATFPKQRYDGVLGIWYGKAPGLDRAGDAIRHAQYAGTMAHGGVLALTGDDPANKSSTLPSASEFTLADLHMPTLHPGNVQEVIDLGLHGIALSRTVGLWTAIKVVTSVADASGTAEVGPGRVTPVIPEIEWNGKPYRPRVNKALGGAPANAVEREIHEVRIELARRYAAANNLNRITVNPSDAWLGIVASGRMYHEVLEALHNLGLDEDGLARNGVRLLQLGMVYPLDGEIARRFAMGLQEVMVLEEKRGFIELHLRDALYGMPEAPRITGKKDPDGQLLVPMYGALDADALVEPLRRRLTQKIDPGRLTPPAQQAQPIQLKRKVEVLPPRTPYFCSGCPHSTGTKAPEDALVGGGIGCHGLVGLMDPKRVGTVMGNTQMGGEGVHWIGIEPFVDVDHFIQNLGDGTFAHSGSLAIRAAVAAKSHVTYKILYNGAVAMTGGQDAAGAMPVPKLTNWLLSEGVSRVIVTTDDLDKYKGVDMPGGVDVWPRERIVEAQEALRKVSGTTVLVHDQQCAAEKRRDRKRGTIVEPPERIVINERVCEGCGDCGVQSNCLSVQPVETEFGRKTMIHQSSCNKDYSCLQGDCPSFLTVVPKKGGSKKKVNRKEGGARRKPALDAADLPEPTLIVPADDATVRMPGVGGTGVVTVSQVLGTAATLDGKHVGGLDQTGLSQKAGPVVSDLRITTQPIEGTNKLTAGSADLYLVFDILVGLAEANLVGVSPERTVAVVSTTKTPTGAMVRDVHATFPNLDLLTADMDAATRADQNRYLDVMAVTEGLFGDTTTANMFQVGVAYQIGALPISAGAIEQAIELNGAAVEANQLAFRWGRMWAVDPERVRAASVTVEDALPKPTPAIESAITAAGLGDGELGRIVRLRAADLVEYQDEKYAKRYLETVRKAAASNHDAFTEAVARYLYKLMAYKDEYEVARLHTEAAAKLNIANAVGDDVTVSYNLHPPMLRALGMKNKTTLGPWFTPVLANLQKGKRLRGTPLDPFGQAKVRKVERQLIKEYRDIVEKLAGKVTADNADLATELASLPDVVRGYEEIKLANVEHYHSELARLRSQLGV
ncbi:MAG: indolepyruvate ferredoxin oxidoreductase family protein [Acidimicrobiia bacterium]|nr:indolepyruvate ferredoxin oxidoreductase family protein [Acidimicrobiia bacterium]